MCACVCVCVRVCLRACVRALVIQFTSLFAYIVALFHVLGPNLCTHIELSGVRSILIESSDVE